MGERLERARARASPSSSCPTSTAPTLRTGQAHAGSGNGPAASAAAHSRKSRPPTAAACAGVAPGCIVQPGYARLCLCLCVCVCVCAGGTAYSQWCPLLCTVLLFVVTILFPSEGSAQSCGAEFQSGSGTNLKAVEEGERQPPGRGGAGQGGRFPGCARASGRVAAAVSLKLSVASNLPQHLVQVFVRKPLPVVQAGHQLADLLRRRRRQVGHQPQLLLGQPLGREEPARRWGDVRRPAGARRPACARQPVLQPALTRVS